MPVGAEQIRQLLLELTTSEEDDGDEVSQSQRGDPAKAKGSSSKAAAALQRGQPRAGAGAAGSRSSKTQDKVATRMQFLRRQHGGSMPVFDDGRPDPGCAFEAYLYQEHVDPRVVPTDQKKLQLHLAGQYDPDLPQVRRVLEDAREAHWKLTAPKGFAALKGIPELQQLLVYTAADVVHYAVGSSKLGAPGDLDPAAFDTQGTEVMLAQKQLRSDALYSGKSLAGQLCPGLRLCLAAEVATGLVCDSQPPPPDTPEHASALLLFLAAAMRRVEQEALCPKGLLPWTLAAADCRAERHLLDFCLALDPHAALQLLQQHAATAGAAAPAAAAAAAGLAGDSISSRGDAGSSRMESGSSSSSSPAVGGSCHSSSAGGAARDEMQGNVVLAALQLATALRGASGCAPADSISSSSSSQGQGSTGSAHHLQQQEEDGWQQRGAPQVQLLLQRLQLQAGHHRQQQQQQQQPGAEAGQPAAQPESQANCSPTVADLASLIRGLIDSCFEQQGAAAGAAVAAADGPEVQPAAAAAGAGSSAGAAAAPAPSEPADCQGLQRAAAAAAAAAADDAAWCIAVTTGAAALGRLFFDSDAAVDGPSVGSQRCRQQQQQQQQQPCPVRAAVLFTAIEGCYWGVREELQQYLVSKQAVCGCPTCVRLQALQEQEQAVRGLDAAACQRECKAGIASKVLAVLQLAQNLEDLSLTGANQQQQQQQQQPSPSDPAPQPERRWRRHRGPALQRARFDQLARRAQHIVDDQLTTTQQRRSLQALWELDWLQREVSSADWFAGAFQQLGSQQQQQGQQGQLSPACLLPRGAAAATAAGEAGEDGDGSEQRPSQRDARKAWQALQRDLQQALQQHLQQQQGSRAAPAGSSAADAPPSASESSSSAAAAAAAAGLDAGQMVHDHLSRWQRDPQLQETALDLVRPLLHWQRYWEASVLQRLRRAVDTFEGRQTASRQARKAEVKAQQQRERKAAKKQTAKQGAGAAASSKAQRLRQQLFGRSGGSDSESDSSSSTSSDSDGDPSGSSKEAAGKAQQQSPGGSKSQQEEEETCCPVCAVEQQAGTLLAELSGSNSSSGGSGQGAQGAGLYANLPVSWSDPFMMRRLLWDLLGRLKPTAQQWFRKHAQMCPHRTLVFLWHALVLCLARHIWAPPSPPGTWGPEQEQQRALLLPDSISSYRSRGAAAQARDEARAQYATALSMAFAHQGSSGQAAAVLSLQALLALDPHGARVQPRPELLLYTPAGFHAAVCKTLMQALQTPVAGLPAPGAGAAAGAVDGSAAAAASGLLLLGQDGQVPEPAAHQAPAGPQGSPAAAAAGRDRQPAKPGTPGEQEQELEELEQQLEQLLQEDYEMAPPPHYLHAWSEGLFPAWYVWWHIGLLAYHQQQQQAQAQQEQQEHKQQGHLDKGQQQQQEQEQQGSWEQQQLGLCTRRAARPAKSGAGSEGVADQQPSPPLSPGTPQPVKAPQAAAAASSTVSGVSGSNSDSGSSSAPVDLQDLYSSPDARLFAVGYAARQISSGAQLQRLLNNPPLPHGLQHPVRHWILGLPRLEPCATCQRPPPTAAAPGDEEQVGVQWDASASWDDAACQENLRHLAEPITVHCMVCCTAFCSGACVQGQSCSPEPATRLAHARGWRILDLLQPPAPTLTPARAPHQQPHYDHTHHHHQQAQAQTAGSPSSCCCLPPASGAALPGILQQWLSTQQQQQHCAEDSSAADKLFVLNSSERAVIQLQLHAVGEARAAAAAAAAAAEAGGGGGSSSSSSRGGGGDRRGRGSSYSLRGGGGDSASSVEGVLRDLREAGHPGARVVEVGPDLVLVDVNGSDWAEDLARDLAGEEDWGGAGRRMPPAAARQRRILSREPMEQAEVQQRRRQWQEQLQQRPGASGWRP